MYQKSISDLRETEYPENAFPEMIENIMKSNQESAEQIKLLNKTNTQQQAELERLNSQVQNLQDQLKKMQDSHKHDTIKAIMLAVISALFGALATIFVPQALDWIIKISSLK